MANNETLPTGGGERPDAWVEIFDVLNQYSGIRAHFDKAGLMRVARECVAALAGTGAPAGTPPSERVWAEIRAERTRQDAKWGGPDHDDEHYCDEWVSYIVEHAREALPQEGRMTGGCPHNIVTATGYCVGCGIRVTPDFRRRMVEVAALAVAAIESEDRKFPASEEG